MFKRLIGYILTALAAIASTVAILGYRAPASFPIVKGIDIPGCVERNPEETNIPEQERFLNDLTKYNRQVVFIDEFSIGTFKCGEYLSRNKKTRDEFKEYYSNGYFDYLVNTLRYDSNEVVPSGGTITVGFKKVYGGAGYAMMLLTVISPGKGEYFSDPGCGENCFGAHGLYKVSVSSSEGVTLNKLEPFPVTSALMDTYQCTLAKLDARTIWEKFSACKF